MSWDSFLIYFAWIIALYMTTLKRQSKETVIEVRDQIKGSNLECCSIPAATSLHAVPTASSPRQIHGEKTSLIMLITYSKRSVPGGLSSISRWMQQDCTPQLVQQFFWSWTEVQGGRLAAYLAVNTPLPWFSTPPVTPPSFNGLGFLCSV